MSISNDVEILIQPIVKELGYDLVEVVYNKQKNGMNLTVFIDSKSGVGLDDCEKVHNAIDSPLDELDPTNGQSYTLNVSSPGLDRPLKNESDFERNIGREIEVSLYTKLNGKKEYIGTLSKFDAEKVFLIIQNEEIAIDKKSISNITKHISF